VPFFPISPPGWRKKRKTPQKTNPPPTIKATVKATARWRDHRPEGRGRFWGTGGSGPPNSNLSVTVGTCPGGILG